MKIYKPTCLLLMFVFAIVGILFLVFPDKVLILFNNVSSYWGMPQSPLIGHNFYLILATGYMYLVTVLAFLMFRNPEVRVYPVLLAHAKLASSFLSLMLFLFHAHYLIYLVNFVIDGFIGLVALYFYFKLQRVRVWVSS
jgi:hypothetical protein